MSQSTEDDKQIKLVQSSTRNLMASFRDKTELLTKCSDDIKLLLREGYDIKLAKETAVSLALVVGKKKFPNTSSLGSKIGRAGDILRKTILSGLNDYERRFSAASNWYESLLKDILIDHSDSTEASETAKKFFGKDKIK